jgi:hypothetical protein
MSVECDLTFLCKITRCEPKVSGLAVWCVNQIQCSCAPPDTAELIYHELVW